MLGIGQTSRLENVSTNRPWGAEINLAYCNSRSSTSHDRPEEHCESMGNAFLRPVLEWWRKMEAFQSEAWEAIYDDFHRQFWTQVGQILTNIFIILSSDVKINSFEPPIESRFIRIVPTKTFRNLPAALRCELYLSSWNRELVCIYE